MAFVVTARKWRPQRFDEVVGQEHITATLKNALKNNRIAHAYLFTGPRGVGKTTTARILAKALNCLNPQGNEPCNECEMCKSIQSTQSLDIIEIDGASNRGIDEIRTLRDSVKYAPTRGKYKIYIIDEVHMLTKESFNAFLKTLEEPPAHTIFIFATTDIHKVPLTIISRCQRFDFRRIQLDTIKDLLSKIAKSEKINIDDKTLTIIAKKSDGALRDAESFFDQVVAFCGNNIEASTVSKMLNLVDDEVYFTISDAILEKNYKSVFEVSNSIYNNGWNFIDFMDGLIEHFRNILTVILTKNSNLVESADIYKTRYLDYADKFSEGDLLRLLNFLNKTQQELRYSQNQKLKIEISLSHLIGLERSSTISELINDLSSSNLNDKSSFTYDQEINTVKTTTASPKKKTQFISSKEVISKQKSDPIKPPISHNFNNSENISNPQFSFDSVIKKWAGFVESVNAEKGLMFGPFIKSVKLINLEGNDLNIFSEDSHGKDIISRNQEYLAKKSLEFFGKRITFHLKDRAKIDPGIMLDTTETEKNESKQKSDDDPFINAIINELGGEEVK